MLGSGFLHASLQAFGTILLTKESLLNFLRVSSSDKISKAVVYTTKGKNLYHLYIII